MKIKMTVDRIPGNQWWKWNRAAKFPADVDKREQHRSIWRDCRVGQVIVT